MDRLIFLAAGGLPFRFPDFVVFLAFLALAEGLLLFDRVLFGNHISSEGSSSYFSSSKLYCSSYFVS